MPLGGLVAPPRVLLLLLVSVLLPVAADAASPQVVVHTGRPPAGDTARSTPGELSWIHVRVPDGVVVEGSAAGRPLRFFPYADGQAALIGLDLDDKAGKHSWRVAIVDPRQEPRSLRGAIA